MKVKIYQLKKEKSDLLFCYYERVIAEQKKINPDDYECVFAEADIERGAINLEDVFAVFNFFEGRPEAFVGRSLSISDVVEIIEGGMDKPGCYYCDTVGWKRLEDFDTSKIRMKEIEVV